MSMRVLVLTHQDIELPDSVEELPEQEFMSIRTEFDVAVALEQLGHEIRTLGAGGDLATIRKPLLDWQPHLVFNLLEEFRGEGFYVPFVLGYLELMRQPFTGCNPSSLLLADNKPLTKKILRYHRIPVPDFAVFPRGRAIRKPTRLEYPLIVKSTTEHGSVGIAQASVVNSDEKLVERVTFVHERLNTDALVERYVEGREFYVGLLGNRRLTVLPIIELLFHRAVEGTPRIATERVKWDLKYQEKLGVTTGPAQDLTEELKSKMIRICKRVYRILGLNGYARMDLRVTGDGSIYLLEPNPNPDLALEEDFAAAAELAGIPYTKLIQRILNSALRFYRSPRLS